VNKQRPYNISMGTLLQRQTAPVVEELTGLDAWEACQRLAGLDRVLFLDSASPSALGRYSYVAAEPFCWLLCRDDDVRVNGARVANRDPWSALRDLLKPFSLPAAGELPPFQGGAAGLFGYELCHHLEKLPRPPWRDFDVPDLALGVYDWVLSFDNERKRAWLISTGLPGTSASRRLRRAVERRDQVLRWLDEGTTARPWSLPPRLPLATPLAPVESLPELYSNFSRKDYLATVRRAIDYVHAGDCFQVNVAQRLVTPQRRPPLDLYHELRRRNPAPFAGYFDLGDYVLASASPERFLKLAGGAPVGNALRGVPQLGNALRAVPQSGTDLATLERHGGRSLQGPEVETRPIKGTRPRGPTPEEDRARAEELRHSAKDRAENVMIVDLLRNDLGRVCAYGSVRVEALCRLESYQYVHHLVSEVRGRLRPDQDAVDLLRATFPGGSVTGAPKIRAMEIIAELERVARGPYCGCLGFLGFDGAMDTSILIRTLVLGRGWVHAAVGGGIVADSDPEREYEETWHKARGLLRALGA
jgi:para-aminobenzoate synthetase component 1